MRQVIKSAAESGDGVSIEREQPSTAFRPMPHITTYGGGYFSAQPEKGSFGSFEPRQEKLQEVFADDQLIGLKGGQEGEELLPTDSDFNDVVIGVKEKVGGFRECSALFTTGGGGDSLTDAGLVFPGLYDSAGYEGSGDLTCMSNAIDCDRNEHGIITETFEPAAGVDFAGSLNPAPGLGGTAGPGATSFMTGQFDFPTNNLTGSADPGGDDV